MRIKTIKHLINPPAATIGKQAHEHTHHHITVETEKADHGGRFDDNGFLIGKNETAQIQVDIFRKIGIVRSEDEF